jgi:hypothetical protein
MSPTNPPASHGARPSTPGTEDVGDRCQRHADAGIRVATGIGARPFRPVERAPKLVALFRRFHRRPTEM